MGAKEKISKIKDIVDSEDIAIQLYFVTRDIREGVAQKAKIVDKYSFRAWAVDIDKGMVNFFRRVVGAQINKIERAKNYELQPYEVIGDDLPNKLYTYALNNALAFADLVNSQMSGVRRPEAMTSLAEVRKGLWAYMLRLTGSDQSALIFRKMSQGKIATDQAQTVGEKISSFFDSTTSELKAAVQESVAFDDKLDCVFIDQEFLVFRKSGFEQIVGLEEEFTNAASDVIDVIRKTNLVEGLELIEDQLSESRALLKTLANIGRRDGHTNFNSEELARMTGVLRKFEKKELRTENGKLVLSDPSDVGYFIKLLNDYYKQGVVSQKFYGTHSGVPLDP